jgi:hypothetical protein
LTVTTAIAVSTAATSSGAIARSRVIPTSPESGGPRGSPPSHP